jgi:hypothetical protein
MLTETARPLLSKLIDANWEYEQDGLVSVDEMMNWTSEKLKEVLAKYQTQLEKIEKIYSPTVSDFAEYSGLKNQVKEIKNILLSRNYFS